MTASPSRPLTAPLLFNTLIEALRHQGLPVGVDHYLRLYELLDRVGHTVAPERLKTLLCPIFATSREQQELFYTTFEQCFAVFDGERVRREDPVSDSRPVTATKTSRQETDDLPRWRRLARRAFRASTFRLVLYGLIIAVDAALLAGRVLLQRAESEAPSTERSPQPSADGGAPPPRPNAAPVAPRTPAVTPRQPTRESQRYRLCLPCTGTSAGIPLSLRMIDVLVILPLVGILAVELFRYRRRRPALRGDHWKKPPFIWHVRVPGLQNPFLRVEELPAVARTLRRRGGGGAASLDVERTIAATIQSLGFPVFHHRAATRPAEYLVLIERAAYRDHQAALFSSLISALEHEGVLTNRYYYDRDPRTCYRESGEGSILLAELQRKHHGHHLLLLGTGEWLLDAISGAPRQWVELIEAWEHRALLTPEPVDSWGLREFTLARHFMVLPATLAGLAQVRTTFDTEPGGRDRLVWDGWVPNAAASGPDGAPSVAVPDVLRAELGPAAYQWLCVCAIYPELHWDLTLHLSTLPELGAAVRTEANLLRLARLPWFRTGVIPDDIRAALIQQLEPSLARNARLAIIDLLERNPPPHDSAAMREYRLQLAVQRFSLASADRQRQRELIAAARSAPRDQVRRQLTFVRLLDSGAATTSTLVLPLRLRRRLLPRVFPEFGMPRLTLAPVGLLAAGLVLATGMSISYVANRRLQRSVEAAMAAASSLPRQTVAVPSTMALITLDSLRNQVETLSRQVHSGPPLWLRWGLYSGDRLYPRARALYFDRFARLLYDSTRAGLTRATRAVAAPNADIPYDAAYRVLRAYLVTTEDVARATPDFVGPALMNAWPQVALVDSTRREVARRQFEFFGSELPYGQPFGDRADGALVASTRGVLARSAGITPIYISMVTAAARHGQPVRFTGGQGVVVNTIEVPAQFTRTAWAFFVDTALTKDLDTFLQGEPWVTGNVVRRVSNRDSLARELRRMYITEYVQAWKRYVKSATIAGFGDLADAGRKIQTLSQPTSPLLAMLLKVSENTVVDSAFVRAPLQPVDVVMPLKNRDTFIGGANQDYMDQLAALSNALHQLSTVPPNADNAAQLQGVLAAAGNVRGAVGKLSRQFAAQPERELALNALLVSPAVRAENLVRSAVADMVKKEEKNAVNDAAAAFCTQAQSVLAKFPFGSSQAVATAADIAKMFKPVGGDVDRFYQQSLAGKVLNRTSSGYVAAPGAAPTPALVTFMNRARRITDALFPARASEPRVQFEVRPEIIGTIPVTLTFGDENYRLESGNTQPIVANWRFGDDAAVAFSRVGANRESTNGPWAAFRMYWSEATPGGPNGSRSYRVTLSGVTVGRVQLSIVGGFFQDPSAFALSCPSSLDVGGDIHAVLAAYTRGIETRDTSLMRSVFPSVPGDNLRNWQLIFDDARDGIQLRGATELLDVPSDAVGTRVRARGQYTAQFNSSANRRATQFDASFTAVLELTPTGWRIISLR
jgi:hypothetical protein